jgi:hypothetical protein
MTSHSSDHPAQGRHWSLSIILTDAPPDYRNELRW